MKRLANATPKPAKRRKKSPQQIIRNALLKKRKAALRRGGRITTRKVSKRFAQRRDADYCAWIRNLPSLVSGVTQTVEVAHVVSRGAGGSDVGNVVPLTRAEHQAQHRIGIKTWAANLFGSLDELKRIARDVYPAQYEKAKTLGWGVSSPEDQ